MSTGWSRRRVLGALGTVPLLGCSGLGSDHVPPRTPSQPRVRLPEVLEADGSGGTHLRVLSDRGLPLVAMAITVPAGHRDEPEGLEGVASLAAAMLLEGIDGDDRVNLLERYGELGTVPLSRADATQLVLRCTVHRDDAPAALQLMVDTLHRATLAEEAFSRVRREQRDALEAMQGSPEQVAAFGVLLGAQGIDPPAAMLPHGTLRSLAALELDQVRQWLAQHRALAGATFTFVGDVDEAEARRFVDDAAARWVDPGATTPAARAWPTAEAIEAPRAVLVPWPDVPQAILAFGGLRLPYGHHDEPAQDVATGLVGGLMRYELRERLRTTYGLHTENTSTKRGLVGQLWAKIDGADMARSLERMRSYLALLQTNVQVKPSMVDGVRRAAMVDVMDAFHGPERALGELLRLADLGLTIEAATQRVERFRQLDAAHVTTVLRRTYAPDRVRVCVVGDEATLAGARDVLDPRGIVVRRPAELLGVPSPA